MSDFKTVGFIGLGAMGRPMVVHLANKLPPESQIYVFDVVQQVMDELSAQFPGRVLKGSSAKDVAEHSVSYRSLKLKDKNLRKAPGNNNHNGPGRIPRPIGIPR